MLHEQHFGKKKLSFSMIWNESEIAIILKMIKWLEVGA